WYSGAAAVDECEFVVAGGQPAPLFDGVKAAFDDVAVLVICRIECWRPAARAAAPLPVGDLIRRFGYDRGDAAPAQMSAGGSARVRLVGTDTVGAGAGPTPTGAVDAQVGHQM